MKKIKRRVGRPPKEMQQIFRMQDSQGEVKEIFAEKYLDAMKYIAELVTDQNANKNLRLTAAKVVKEQVEAWLLEHEEANEQEDSESENPSPTQIVI